MKISEKERMLFDYMQEQANNLLDFCERNGISVENPGYFVDPETGYSNISATVIGDKEDYILCRDKHHNIHGGKWDEGVSVNAVKKERGE